MSWFSNVISIDERVEKATSESLPTGEQDLALNLEICDLIRSKTVPPKDAMRSLKKRLNHKNPNVQILTLHLIDICIKNGGSHFLVEIASREFMDSFVLVLKPTISSGITVNPDVKELMLEYLQNWAHAFQGQIQLNYVNKIHDQLKAEGFQFPSGTRINSSFIDSSAPPEWVDADECMKCGTPFSFVNRKHHCRNCGGVYIQKHCNNYIALPHYGINEPVRVCDDCFDKLKGGDNKIPPKKSSTSNTSNGIQNISNNRDLNVSFEQEDADIQRALQLSLQESQNRPGLVKPSNTVITTTKKTNDDELDDDMKAAIAASLRDMENENPNKNNSTGLYQTGPEQQQQQPNSTQYYNEQYNSGNDPALSPSIYTPVSNQEDEFSALESEIVHRYVQLVEGLQRAPPGTVLKETKLQQLNDNVSALRPKLARDLRRTIEKCDQLEDLHGKLTAVVRYYDKLLEDRFAYTTKRYELPAQNTGASPYTYTNVPSQQSQYVNQSYQQPQPQPQQQYQQQPQSQYSPQQSYVSPVPGSVPPSNLYSGQQPPPINPQFSGNSIDQSLYPQQHQQYQQSSYQTSNEPSAPPLSAQASGSQDFYPSIVSPGQGNIQQGYVKPQSQKPEDEPILIEL